MPANPDTRGQLALFGGVLTALGALVFLLARRAEHTDRR